MATLGGCYVATHPPCAGAEAGPLPHAPGPSEEALPCLGNGHQSIYRAVHNVYIYIYT